MERTDNRLNVSLTSTALYINSSSSQSRSHHFTHQQLSHSFHTTITQAFHHNSIIPSTIKTKYQSSPKPSTCLTIRATFSRTPPQIIGSVSRYLSTRLMARPALGSL